MSLSLTCPQCATVYTVLPRQVGRVVVCPRCWNRQVAREGALAEEADARPVERGGGPGHTTGPSTGPAGPVAETGWAGVRVGLGLALAGLLFSVAAFALLALLGAGGQAGLRQYGLLAGVLALLGGLLGLLGRGCCLTAPPRGGLRGTAVASFLCLLLGGLLAGVTVMIALEVASHGGRGGAPGLGVAFDGSSPLGMLALGCAAALFLGEVLFLVFLGRIGRVQEDGTLRGWASFALLFLVAYAVLSAFQAASPAPAAPRGDFKLGGRPPSPGPDPLGLAVLGTFVALVVCYFGALFCGLEAVRGTKQAPAKGAALASGGQAATPGDQEQRPEGHLDQPAP